MNLDSAFRLTEIFLAWALIQQSIEHLRMPGKERFLFLSRLMLSLLLLFGLQTHWVCLALLGLGIWMLQRFQGPYNGGSDRMGLFILCCLCLAYFMPSERWQEAVFGYLALQCILSYFIAGWVKLMNPEWRSGRALQDVLLFSAYPASESIRAWAGRSQLICAVSWVVISFEILFPLSLLTHMTLIIGLVFAATFHFANACLFGLNRFFWIWLAAYPSLLWLQQRLFL